MVNRIRVIELISTIISIILLPVPYALLIIIAVEFVIDHMALNQTKETLDLLFNEYEKEVGPEKAKETMKEIIDYIKI